MFYPKMSHLQQESFQITLMVQKGVLIERAHYYTIIAEEGRNIR